MGMTYLSLGDSTTTSVTVGANYPTLIYRYIRDTYGALKFIHKGAAGLKALDFIKHPWYFTKFNADIVTLGVGFNDSVASAAGIAQFKADVTATINRLKLINENIKIILCTSNNGLLTGDLQLYRVALAEVATSTNSYICNFEIAWTPAQNGTYTSDNVHPNEAGHVLLSNLLKPIIDEIL